MASLHWRLANGSSAASSGQLREPCSPQTLHSSGRCQGFVEGEANARHYAFLKCGEGRLVNSCNPINIHGTKQPLHRRPSDACTSSTLSTISGKLPSEASSPVASQPLSNSSSVISSAAASIPDSATSSQAPSPSSPSVSVPSSPAPPKRCAALYHSKAPTDKQDHDLTYPQALGTKAPESSRLPVSQIDDVGVLGPSCSASFFEEVDVEVRSARITEDPSNIDFAQNLSAPILLPVSPRRWSPPRSPKRTPRSPVARIRSPVCEADLTTPEASPVSLHSFVFDYDGTCQQLLHVDAETNRGEQRRMTSRSRSLCMSSATDPLLRILETSFEESSPSPDGVGVLLHDADGPSWLQQSSTLSMDCSGGLLEASLEPKVSSPHRLASSSSLRDFAMCSTWASLRKWIHLD